jgi:hypothetical protein
VDRYKRQVRRFREGRDDAAGVAASDQTRAEALEILRTSDSWFLVASVEVDDGKTLRTTALGQYSSGGEAVEDTASLCRAAAELLCAAWFSCVNPESFPENALILMRNFAFAVSQAMQEIDSTEGR